MNVHSATKPLPPPALPWTERYLGWASPQVRKRTLVAWESIPRMNDLLAPRSYLHGQRIHRTLFDEGFYNALSGPRTTTLSPREAC